MKKIIALLMALLILMSMAACGSGQPAPAEAPEAAEPTVEPTVEPSPEPAPTEPVWEEGIARAGWGEAVYELEELGTKVNVAGKINGYYIVAGEELELLVDGRMLRLAEEKAFEPWDGYCYHGISVFSDAYMDADPIAALDLNTKVKVVEGKANWLRIEWDGNYGYVDAESVSRGKIVYSSGGGSKKDGTDVALGDLAALPAAKPRLSLMAAYCGPEYEKLEAEAEIITHDARLCLFITERDDSVKVTELGEKSCKVYVDGYYAELPRWLVRMEGDELYESWTGYAKSRAVLYTGYQMQDKIKDLTINDKLLVIDELPMCYVVDMDGQIGYVPLDRVSKSSIGYGGGGGGSSVPWTPPVL